MATLPAISISKAIKENINKWDDLCVLKDEQIKSILMLSQFNQFEPNETDLINYNMSDSEVPNSNEQTASKNQLNQVKFS
jgi:hypothetical protein